MTRPADAAAVAYVVQHFATHDYDMIPLCVAVTASDHGEDCTDVHFVDARGDFPTHADRCIMTVWHDTDGALYGEW